MPMVTVLAVKKIQRILDSKLHESYSKITVQILRFLIAQAVLVMVLFVFTAFYAVIFTLKYDTLD